MPDLFSGEPPSKRVVLLALLWHRRAPYFGTLTVMKNMELKSCSFRGNKLLFDASAGERIDCCVLGNLRRSLSQVGVALRRSYFWHQAQVCMSLARVSDDTVLKQRYEDLALEFAKNA